MRVCPKCRDYYADRLLGFCLADGTPLVDVDPNSDLWDQAARVIEQKQNVVKTQQRRFKWRRAMLRAMLMTTMVVSVAAVIRSFSVTVVQPTGDLCVREFDDRNGDGNQDPGEAGLSGFEFQVSGTGDAIALKTEKEGDVCRNLPVGTYTVVETPKPGWTPTTETTRTAIVAAGQPAKVVLFGIRQEAKLCIRTFDDLNGDGKQDAGEAGLSGFEFQVSGTGAAIPLETEKEGDVCWDLPVGTYTVVETPKPGWTPTTETTRTVIVAAGQPAKVMLFGSRQEAKLCIRTFNDLNGDGNQDPGEAGLSGFEFQMSGTGAAIALKTEKQGDVCRDLPVGTYTVVETPKPGWTPTTETTRTVIVTAGQPAKVLFGSRQEAELCIGTFNDLNGNRRQDAGEQGLPEFDFQVRGADTKTLTTDFKGAICSALPVGTYTVVETPKPGWTATTRTTQTVILTANQAVNLRFGNTKSKPVCSDIDKKREWQIISDRYDASWRRIIEAEPPSVKGGVPILGEIEYLSPSFLTCTTALVTAKSVWKVQSPRGVVPVRKERRFDCVKTGDTWNCN
jgi:uncharacterized protein (DUF2141 family)